MNPISLRRGDMSLKGGTVGSQARSQRHAWTCTEDGLEFRDLRELQLHMKRKVRPRRDARAPRSRDEGEKGAFFARERTLRSTFRNKNFWLPPPALSMPRFPSPRPTAALRSARDIFAARVSPPQNAIHQTAWSNTSLVGCRVSVLLDNRE